MRAIVMNGTGGREMMEHVERPDPVVGPGQALVEIAFAGVNFMDIGVRQGMAWTDTPNPKVLGASKEAGADHVIVDAEGRFAEEAFRLTNGEGVHVVYDGSGPKTFQGSLDVLRRSGTFCWYGPVLGGPGHMSLPKSIKIGYATFLLLVP
jgi:NADPH2:quinone reductase